MLVLSRKVGEEIVIDGKIRVRVLEVQGRRVRLGIVAPDEIPVLRSEVQTRRNKLAVPSDTDQVVVTTP
ncbi:hypothetical protein A3C37_02610 [Candidatus Peribacteria bacterium RIFCSPHIGHO2_02_FULL_53_20]|nr:MAG: hypothetical protein A3C37_02610 [Candidatus Peribacteria bacterium RIFCSPHIGHO2_02_FULL_53_20]OGJ66730.1 MAG: hypothetical protein A3B61_02645 [Candidatus Peribacteria bacterium RIFCSPLOWO2_01_FULL_53_10]OGJ71247.1 MAG: hypothetical protein A3G69_01155 [Candidatus Peribacteria bacterium RIFCSPLOWO2_12_FULL_53_10]